MREREEERRERGRDGGRPQEHVRQRQYPPGWLGDERAVCKSHLYPIYT